jgi:hypothetical protein
VAATRPRRGYLLVRGRLGGRHAAMERVPARQGSPRWPPRGHGEGTCSSGVASMAAWRSGRSGDRLNAITPQSVGCRRREPWPLSARSAATTRSDIKDAGIYRRSGGLRLFVLIGGGVHGEPEHLVPATPMPRSERPQREATGARPSAARPVRPARRPTEGLRPERAGHRPRVRAGTRPNLTPTHPRTASRATRRAPAAGRSPTGGAAARARRRRRPEASGRCS